MSDNDDIEVESDEEQPRFQSAADKRAHHNALERKRRDHIKDSFHSLRDSVPSLQGEKITGEARGLNTWFSQPYASAGDKQGKQMAARSEEDVQEPVRRARLLREDRGQLPRRQPQPQLRRHILGSKTVTEATASQADRLPPELLPNATEFLEHRNRWKSLALGWNGCHLCALFSVMATAC
ncbi:protein max isoform X13 [Cavia porcellus]|uniref:protein max isoform X13 n=1 Tax=Cavia porcellus TaxID=10141 RepID=UPI002FDFA2CF